MGSSRGRVPGEVQPFPGKCWAKIQGFALTVEAPWAEKRQDQNRRRRQKSAKSKPKFTFSAKESNKNRVRSDGGKSAELAEPIISTPEVIPYCKTCGQVWGEHERELLPDREEPLKWRVHNAKQMDNGKWGKVPGNWECYYCWDDRRYNELPNRTQDMVIAQHKKHPEKKDPFKMNP